LSDQPAAGNADECPFRQDQIQDLTFAESSHTIVIANRHPIVPGHSLVIPRRHVESVFELSAVELADLFRLARTTTRALLAIYEAEGFDWALQEGAVAGQTVAHLHVHLIPRRSGDPADGTDWFGLLEQRSGRQASKADAATEAARLRSFLRGG
jgi:diadenosine tetraphosphate (Ap4A) HIT family hydrolase